MTTRATELLVGSGNPRSLAGRARRRRWDEMVRRFPGLCEMRVIDLGGWPSFWRGVEPRPAHVTMVNLGHTNCHEPWMELRVGDACDPPVQGTFDLVVSNSLLEHVGGHWRRRQLAEVVHRLADRHWIQTPYRYFPVEPHWVAPGMQFLPVKARALMARSWPLGHMRSESSGDPTQDVLDVELISATEMAYYFPDSTIWHERMAGVTKSLVAVK